MTTSIRASPDGVPVRRVSFLSTVCRGSAVVCFLWICDLAPGAEYRSARLPEPVAVAGPQTIRAGKDYALLFATDEYEAPEWQRLSNPVNDARALAEKLSSKFGFKTEVVTNATSDEVMETLDRYRDKAYEKDDQLLVFFAGHGAYDPKLKHGYVVTRDSRYIDPRHKSYIDHAMLLDSLASITNCHHVLLILDVCFGGAIGERISVSSYRGYDEYAEMSPATIVVEGLKSPSRLFLTSGGVSLVPDGKPGQNSPFTSKLLTVLSDGGKDGVLTMKDVRAALQRVNPMPRGGSFEGNTPEGDFLFISASALRGHPASNQTDAPPSYGAINPAPVGPATINVSPPQSRPALTKLGLGDFKEIFGLKVGAKTEDVRALLGEANVEYTEGGSFRDRDLVWAYRAGGTENFKVIFDNQAKVIRSIAFDENHLSWLASRGVDDSKLALLGKTSSDIERLIGRPSMTYSSTIWYEGKGLDVEFLCAEHNRFKCSRIIIHWSGR